MRVAWTLLLLSLTKKGATYLADKKRHDCAFSTTVPRTTQRRLLPPQRSLSSLMLGLSFALGLERSAPGVSGYHVDARSSYVVAVLGEKVSGAKCQGRTWIRTRPLYLLLARSCALSLFPPLAVPTRSIRQTDDHRMTSAVAAAAVAALC